jgi:thiazole synthase
VTNVSLKVGIRTDAEPAKAPASEDSTPPLKIGTHEFKSRLIMGSGRYQSFELMQDALSASATEIVTFAVRRERLHDSSGRNILDYVDLSRFQLLPNTAGCYDAMTAVRSARMGREILRNLNVPIVDWVKLEVLGDSRTLMPEPIETLRATEILVAEGFEVLCYASDDPLLARRLKNAGAVSVMPAGSPIGSGLGILNPSNLRIIIEDLKSSMPEFPIIVDAGIGTASDAALAMELGADAVLLNSAVARAKHPVTMAHSMRLAVEAGFLAAHSGRIPKSTFGSASSPVIGVIAKKRD